MSFITAFREVRKAQAEQKRTARIQKLFSTPAAVELMRDIVKRTVVEADTVMRLQDLMQEDIHPSDSGILVNRDGPLKAETF